MTDLALYARRPWSYAAVNSWSLYRFHWRLAFGLVLALGQLSGALGQQSLQELREIESQIQDVVLSTAAATVVVSDGRGSVSGVVVSPDGWVLTAGHVLTTGGSDFRVTFPDGRRVKARVVGKNLDVDAGMVKVTEEGTYPYVELGSCEPLQLGDWVVCLGHPGGFDLGRDPPVRAGKIIAIKPTQLITDCALIGGDSGGPLFDLNGRLVGIHSSISYDSIAINRHVMIDTFRQYWERMKSGESWGQLPELTNEDDEALRARAGMGISLDTKAEAEARITRVKPGSVGELAGLRVGDRILEFDGTQVTNAEQLIELVKTKDPGDKVILVFDRDGQQFEIALTLEQIGP
jgi:serine protease Do